MLLPLVLVAGIFTATPENVFEDAKWLRDPRFKSEEIRENPENLHTLFRREFTLKATPAQAHLYVTGDDGFRLYFNDTFAVGGPAPAHHTTHPFFWLDVSTLLREGLNTVGAQAYYHGQREAAGDSGEDRSGFLMVLDMTFADGSRERIVTDEDWRAWPFDAFAASEGPEPNGRFRESIDLRKAPTGWRRNGFDDREWPLPATGYLDHRFVLQRTPPLEYTRYAPHETRRTGTDRHFFDFGMYLVGHTRLELRGEAGQEVVVRHGEELSGEYLVRSTLASGVEHEETVTLTGGDDVYAFFDYKGFRYVEVEGIAAPPAVTVEVRHYPFNRSAVRFASDDEDLEILWALNRNSVRMGVQDTYLDNPGRTRYQYMGNAYLASRSHMWLTGDTRLARAAIEQYQRELAWNDGIPPSAPGHRPDTWPEQALAFPMLVESYLRFSGDTAFAEEIMTDTVPELFRRLARHENSLGVLAGLDADSHMGRLPASLRDGYDLDRAAQGFCAVQNAFYYGALRAAARTDRTLGRNGTGYEAKATRIEEAFAKELADRRRKVYRDAPGARNHSFHANGLALAFGLTAGVEKQAIIDLLGRKGVAGDLFTTSFVLDGLFREGAADLAYRWMTDRGPRSWHAMVAAGATATMESWPDEPGTAMSWCHAPGSSPLWLLTEHVLGLRPGESGSDTLHFAPIPVASLPAMELSLPHPAGPLTVRHAPDEGYSLWAPYGIEVHPMADDDMGITVHQDEAPPAPVVSSATAGLSAEDRAHLIAEGWEEQVGEGLGVWVDVDRQHFYVLRGLDIVWDTVCATATLGTGNVAGSYQTPLGWHVIDEKHGDGAPWGQVFRGRVATSEIWQPGMDTEEDLVLTRILWLDGLEPGQNKGRNSAGQTVDSKQRYIYIHGTNGEIVLGTPSSHGCIRLGNDDVIRAFEKLPTGVKVLITERTGASAVADPA